MQARLRRAESRLAASQAETLGIFRASRAGQETGLMGAFYWSHLDGTIVDANEAFLHMLGYTREEFERDGLNWRALTPPEYLHLDENAIREVKERGYCTPFEKAYRAKDGTVIPIQIGVAVFEGGTDRGVCWILDVRERKRLEAERDRLLEQEQEARREAEAANRAKDQFLAVVSHELRTPLTAILGWVKLLQSGPSSHVMRERALVTIERNAQLQARLIDDILDVSRIIAGKLVLDLSEFGVDDVVEAAADSLRPAYREKGVELWVDIEPALPAIVADASRLQQVIWNVMQNALKFTPAGGSVHVRAFRCGLAVTIEIIDTGQGIKPEFLPHVFERFRQADSSATRLHRGLGLGLAIVRQLVTLHGGTVRARSDGPGRGTTIAIELPASLASLTPSASMERELERDREREREAHHRRLDGIHVLVVDDEPDIRELAAHVLSQRGARTTCAESVADALDAVRRDRPDVVVSDITMPNADGFELLRGLQSLEGDRPLATCALSALASAQDRFHILAAGFDAHLAKPVLPDKLVETVFHLSRRSPADSSHRSQNGRSQNGSRPAEHSPKP